MERRALQIHRWRGHRLDIRVVTETMHGPLFFADDVCSALLLDLHAEPIPGDWRKRVAYIYPGITHTLEGYLTDDEQPEQFYTATGIASLISDYPSGNALEFSRFIDQLLASIAGTPRRLLAAARPAMLVAVDPVPPVEAMTVRAAADTLSRDPAIMIGRDALFEMMRRDLGWIDRDNGIWIPAEFALGADYLTRPAVNDHRHRIHYPQIRITRTGLLSLHERLGGITTLTTDAAPALTLLELS